jgi:hypothetical protein
LTAPLVQGGEVVGREPLEDARQRHLRARAELPLVAHQMSRGEPAIPTRYLRAEDAAPVVLSDLSEQRQ